MFDPIAKIALDSFNPPVLKVAVPITSATGAVLFDEDETVAVVAVFMGLKNVHKNASDELT